MSVEEELEKQLHEQYAINNNAHLSSVVSLMVAMLAVFYAFGYMFLHSSVTFSDAYEFVDGCNNIYTLDAFIVTAIATNVVLGVMITICIYQGFVGRYEQFIMHTIRLKYDMVDAKKGESIFPSYYHPFFKQGMDIPQGLFGLFVKIFIALTVFIQLIVVVKLGQNILLHHNNGIDNIGVLYVVLYVIVFMVECYMIYRLWMGRVEKYRKIQEEYSDKMSLMRKETTCSDKVKDTILLYYRKIIKRI